jgi:hypothetical protein
MPIHERFWSIAVFLNKKTTWNANAAGGNPFTVEGRRFFENNCHGLQLRPVNFV